MFLTSSLAEEATCGSNGGYFVTCKTNLKPPNLRILTKVKPLGIQASKHHYPIPLREGSERPSKKPNKKP